MQEETLIMVAKLQGIKNPTRFTHLQLTEKMGKIAELASMSQTRFVNWVAQSQNKKLGPVPCSYASIPKYCPPTCALKGNGCYAQGGNVRIHEQGADTGKYKRSLLEAMKTVSGYANIARHRVSGDVYNPDGLNDVEATMNECEVINAFGLHNIGYTHSWEYAEVEPLKKWFRASCDSYEDLEMAIALGWGAVLTVVEFNDKVEKRIAKIGERLGMELSARGCPAQKTSNDIDCNRCTLCKITDAQTGSTKTKKSIVVFSVHGGLKKKASGVLEKLQKDHSLFSGEVLSVDEIVAIDLAQMKSMVKQLNRIRGKQ